MEVIDISLTITRPCEQAAKHFRISKITVHKDVASALRESHPSLAAETRKVLDINKSSGTSRRDGDKGEISASACVDLQAKDNF